MNTKQDKLNMTSYRQSLNKLPKKRHLAVWVQWPRKLV